VNRYVYLKLVLFIWYHFTEQQRGTERVLRKVGRDIERDRRGLDKEEKKLVSLKGSSVLSVGNHCTATSRFFRRILCETSLMKQESVIVTHAIRQTGIPALLDSWVTNIPSLKMMCTQKLLSLIFSLKHNMPNCLSVKDRSSIFCFL